MCPGAYCEDHLPEGGFIVGHCARFEALGAKHPKQACYIFCSQDCVKYAEQQGLATDTVSAGVVLSSTGVDLRAAAPPPRR